MDLTFDVSNQIVTRTDSNKSVNFSENYLKLVFTFKTQDWTGLDKYVYFKADDGDYRFELENNELIVPSVVLTGNRITFGLFGESENVVRITTNLVIIRLIDSHFTDGGVAILDRIDELYAIKVSYTDVVDDLTHTDTDKPLSAKQGKVLKDTVDTKANSSDMTTALAGKSDVGHHHSKSDIVDFGHTHTKSEITDFAHNHDDRYYTETETDEKLSGKANTYHTHHKSDITDFAHTHDDRYYTESEVDTRLFNKVDKEIGKTLTTNDYTTTEKNKLAGIETQANKTIVDDTLSPTSTNPLQNKAIHSLLGNKVDKVTGKALSSNDFTDVYKDILDTFDGDWSEVIDDNLDTIIAGVIDAVTASVLNRVVFEATPEVIQSGGTSVFKAYCLKNGLPVYNAEVSFYEVFDPVVVNSATPSVIQTGDVSVWTAKVRDSNDGSLVIGQEVKFYIVSEDEEEE